MHILQPKHSKLSEKESEELLKKLNISESQLPKIFSDDTSLPEGSQIGDIIKIERTTHEGKPTFYYRVVV
jgi:DNA-directed RNA polymerase subunit H (RpoH/RPB5)